MDNDSRERLVRIETILTESVVPRLDSYGPRIRVLEKVAIVGGAIWTGVCIGGYMAKEIVLEWAKKKLVSGS